MADYQAPLGFWDWFQQSPGYNNFVSQYGRDYDPSMAYANNYNDYSKYANDSSKFGYTQSQLEAMKSNLGTDRAGGGQSFTQGLQAVNPATGQMQGMSSVAGPTLANGDPSARYFFNGAPNTPSNATPAMAGGYSSGSGRDWMEPLVLGGLAAIATAGAGSALGGAGGSAAAGGTASGVGGGAAAAGGDAALGSGLMANAGTADVLGAGGTLSGGAFSSAGGAGLVPGAAGGGLSVSPAASLASGWGGATGAAGSAASSTGTIGSILGAITPQTAIGTGLQLFGLNQLGNAYRNIGNAAKQTSSLDQPQRAPYQQNLSQLINNPQQYLSTDPFATSLAAMYRNNIIPRQVAQSGNPASVIDQQGSQFVNAIAGNYNQQVGNLSGIAGFGFPQNPYAGNIAAQGQAGAANANFASLGSLANLFGNNMSGVKVQGQSGTSGPFGTAWS